MARRAFITGITGQDGSYLAELLLEKGYEVHGLVRRLAGGPGPNLAPVAPRLALHEGDMRDGRSLLRAIAAAEPEEVYNLAADSHVPASWERPVESADCNALGVARLLDAVIDSGCEARVFQASTSEIFGGSGGVPQDESTALRPRTPYGAAKAYGHLLIGSYRRRGLFACSGILFNHESPRRPERFVTRRVTAGVAAIKLGLAEELPIGNLGARRDWGYAPEYMEAAWRMLQAEEPGDFVIGSGRAHSVEELVRIAFAEVGLEPAGHLRSDPAAARPDDEDYALADPARARELLGWSARTDFRQVVREMVEADLERADGRLIEPSR